MGSSFAHQPIIIDGLSFSIDSYNTKSYVSGSTSVSDLTINTTGGTLVNGGASRWNGQISNVKIYNRALSSDEILQNYNATKYRFI